MVDNDNCKKSREDQYISKEDDNMSIGAAQYEDFCGRQR